MKKVLFVLLLITVYQLVNGSSALAECENDQIEVVGQWPDIVLVSGRPLTDCDTSTTGNITHPWTYISNGKHSCGAKVYTDATDFYVPKDPWGDTISKEIMWGGLGAGTLKTSIPFCVSTSASPRTGNGVINIWDSPIDGDPDPMNIKNHIGTINVYIMQNPSEYPLAFVHVANRTNSIDNYTLIDNGFTDENPYAKLLVTRRINHPTPHEPIRNVGVFYSTKYRKWAIFNQDHVPMGPGSSFNVRIEGNHGRAVSYRARNRAGSDKEYLDFREANNNPYATIFITASHPAGITPSRYNDHPVGVGYDEALGLWYIANEDGAKLPNGMTFNVKVVSIADYGEVKTSTENLEAFLGSGVAALGSQFTDKNQIVFATHRIDWEAQEAGRDARFPYPIGVFYNGENWGIVSQASNLTMWTGINVFAAIPPIVGDTIGHE